MKIISRDWIKDDSIFFDHNSSVTKPDLCLHINFWKKFLLDNGAFYQCKVGLATKVNEIYYLALTFACLELGLNLVILAKPYKLDNDISINPYFPLDLLLIDIVLDDKEFYDYYLNNSNKVITNLDKIIPDLTIKDIGIFAKPDDICLSCLSSGTTNNPKKIEHSHKFFYDLCSLNYKSLEFQDNDVVLHLYTFQHGSSMSIHFLPSLHKCKTHYFYDQLHNITEEKWNQFSIFCREKNITRLQSPYNAFTEKILKSIHQSSGCPELTISVLSFINPNWLDIVKQDKLKKIVSIFGCSETAGPLFLPFIDKDTVNLNSTCLGKAIEEYYKISLDNNVLQVYIPTYNKTICTEDILEYHDGQYYFIGKNKIQRINDIEINLKDLRNILIKSTDHKFNEIIIIVDEIYNKLYIATEDKKLCEYKDKMDYEVKRFYNNKVEINDVIYLFDLEYFVAGGIKPNREKILKFIRQVNNEQY